MAAFGLGLLVLGVLAMVAMVAIDLAVHPPTPVPIAASTAMSDASAGSAQGDYQEFVQLDGPDVNAASVDAAQKLVGPDVALGQTLGVFYQVRGADAIQVSTVFGFHSDDEYLAALKKPDVLVRHIISNAWWVARRWDRSWPGPPERRYHTTP